MAQPLIDFVHSLRWQDVPAPVQDRTRDFLVDLLGVAAGGIGTRLSQIIRDHAADQFGAGAAPARMLLGGRPVRPAGAPLPPATPRCSKPLIVPVARSIRYANRLLTPYDHRRWASGR